MNTVTQLPPKVIFYRSLTDKSIKQKDYEHAQKDFQIFNCETLGDYHDLYLKIDVTLLAEVFQTFRKYAWMDTNLILYTIIMLITGCITQTHKDRFRNFERHGHAFCS